MGLFDLFSKKQKKANQTFLAQQRSQQAIAKIKKLDLPADFKQQLIDAKVYEIWLSSKDLRPLVNLMQDGEKIEYATVGINEKNAAVLLACTNQRLIILSKKMTGESGKAISLAQIKSVVLKHQLMYDELTLIVGNDTLDINSIDKTTAPIFAENLKKWSKIAQGNSNLDEQVEQIKKLKELLDQGILTEAEFKAKKKKILDI